MSALSSNFFDTLLSHSSAQGNLNVICESFRIVLTFLRETFTLLKLIGDITNTLSFLYVLILCSNRWKMLMGKPG